MTRRLARRGGVKRLSGLVYDETESMRGVLKVLLENMIRDAFTYHTEHAKLKTLTAMDDVYCLKRQRGFLYGFEVKFHRIIQHLLIIQNPGLFQGNLSF